MGIRVVGVHSGAMDEDSPDSMMAREMADMERDCMKQVAAPDTEIVMRWPNWGLRDVDGFNFPLTNRLSERNAYHQIVAAEKEGFDAAVVICAYDPMLRELKTAVDIPVVGLTEAALHTASIIGGKFGVVSMASPMTSELDAMVDRYGLRQKCAGVVTMTSCPFISEDDPEAEMSQLIEGSVEALKEPVGELTKQGADIIYIA